MDPIQRRTGRRATGAEVEPDRVRLLLAPLELEAVAELFGEQPDSEDPAPHLDRLGELLPELGDRRGQGTVRPLKGDDRTGPEAEFFPARPPQPIAAERARHPALSVDMAPALPIRAAAGILIDLEGPGLDRPGRLPDLRRPVDVRLTRSVQLQLQRQITEQD
jgi:hypothetical protein